MPVLLTSHANRITTLSLSLLENKDKQMYVTDIPLSPFLNLCDDMPLHLEDLLTLNAKRADAQVLVELNCCPQHTKAMSPGEDGSGKGESCQSNRIAPGITVNGLPGCLSPPLPHLPPVS